MYAHSREVENKGSRLPYVPAFLSDWKNPSGNVVLEKGEQVKSLIFSMLVEVMLSLFCFDMEGKVVRAR